MINRKELKLAAKGQIKGNIGILFLISLVVSLICGIIAQIPMVGGLVDAVILSPAFSIAVVGIYLGMTAGIKPKFSMAFDGFKVFWGAFKVQFFVGLFTMLWTLLLVIPGIIKSISYSMAMYILAENPEMPALEAINRSKQIMDGHKMDYFVLNLSFIGWGLLSIVTLGIAFIWVGPYISATLANFYNAIKNENSGYAEITDKITDDITE